MLAILFDIINKYYMLSLLNLKTIHLKWYNNVINEENSNIGVLRDMIDIRDGYKHWDVLEVGLHIGMY